MAPSSAAPSHAQVEATTTDYDTPAAAAASDPNDPERKSPAEAGLADQFSILANSFLFGARHTAASM